MFVHYARSLPAFSAVFTLALAVPAPAANLKLYTTDGEYQLVPRVSGHRRSGEVLPAWDRNEWEEVPTSIVDLKRTEAEAAVKKEALDRVTKQFDEEEAAVRAERADLAKIPQDFGVYSLENGTVRTFPLADITVHTPKANTILRVLSPLPIIEGKATVELAGDRSKNVVTDRRPEFFFRLSKQQSFALVKLTPQKNARIVEHLEIIPVSKETTETRVSVQMFSKQLPGENFYRVWPQEPLEPGEYGLMEYLDGKVELLSLGFSDRVGGVRFGDRAAGDYRWLWAVL